MSTVREIKGHFNDICEGIQKMIEFKPEVQENAENMMQLMKEFVESGGHRTSEARKLLKLLESLKGVHGIEYDTSLKQDTPVEDQTEKLPLEQEVDIIKQKDLISSGSKFLHEKSNIKTSQINSLPEDTEYHERVNTLQENVDSKREGHEDTFAKLERITNLYVKSKKKVISLSEMNDKNRRNRQILKYKLEKQEQKITSLHIKLEKLIKKDKENAKEIQKEKSKVDEELSSLRKQLQDYEKNYAELNHKMSVLKTDHEEGRRSQNLQHDNNRANEKIKNLEKIIAKNDRISDLEKNNIELENSRKVETAKWQANERENRTLTFELKKYKEEIEKVNRLSQEKLEENTNLLWELKVCRKENEKLNQNLHKIGEEKRNLTQKLNAYKNDNEQFIQDLSKEREKNIRLMEELNTCKKGNEELNRNVLEKMKENICLRREQNGCESNETIGEGSVNLYRPQELGARNNFRILPDRPFQRQRERRSRTIPIIDPSPSNKETPLFTHNS